jgi:hypothetical protein
MALATGSQHMNLLAPRAGATPRRMARRRRRRSRPQSGSTATFVLLAATDAAKFTPGSIIAVDGLHRPDRLCGLAGLGRVCAPGADRCGLHPARDLQRGAGFAGQLDGLTLAEPLAGRRSRGGRKVQAVTGFVDREGGSFYQEWSALFVMEGSQGERIFFHYPRLAKHDRRAEEAANPTGRQASRQASAQCLLKGQFHGAASYGSAGWRTRAVLSQLSARSQCAGVTSRRRKSKVNSS